MAMRHLAIKAQLKRHSRHWPGHVEVSNTIKMRWEGVRFVCTNLNKIGVEKPLC